MVANPSSALGEAVGKLFETAIIEGIKEAVEERGHSVRPARLKNGSGNVYQIDAVVFDQRGNPVIIIDPKYIRYTKHNRDKGSWLCVAHYNLRKTFPTIRKSIAVLAGRWSQPSKALVRSFGVEILELPFQKMVEVLAKWNISFNWSESDRLSSSQAWQDFEALSDATRTQIAFELAESILDHLRGDIIQVLETDLSGLSRRVSQVEVLLKTDQDETLLLTFNNVTNALEGMMRLVSDRADISDLLKPKH
ncbi:MAG: hypothetical protein HYX84_09005 [Chloroflexi bacterium]|nr:hypothetical protein [Chloroflexota bacterium]